MTHKRRRGQAFAHYSRRRGCQLRGAFRAPLCAAADSLFTMQRGVHRPTTLTRRTHCVCGRAQARLPPVEPPQAGRPLAGSHSDTMGRMASQFLDRARIYVKGGDGGNGVMSFRRGILPRGGPTAAAAGAAAASCLKPASNSTPSTRCTTRCTIAPNGAATAPAPTARAPRGRTCTSSSRPARWCATPITGDLLADLEQPGDQVVVAPGGRRGGRGNSAFKTAPRSTPRFAGRTRPGSLAGARAEAGGRRRHRRRAQCRQEHAAQRHQRRTAQDCRLSLYHRRPFAGRGRSGPPPVCGCRHSRPARARTRARKPASSSCATSNVRADSPAARRLDPWATTRRSTRSCSSLTPTWPTSPSSSSSTRWTCPRRRPGPPSSRR